MYRKSGLAEHVPIYVCMGYFAKTIIICKHRQNLVKFQVTSIIKLLPGQPWTRLTMFSEGDAEMNRLYLLIFALSLLADSCRPLSPSAVKYVGTEAETEDVISNDNGLDLSGGAQIQKPCGLTDGQNAEVKRIFLSAVAKDELYSLGSVLKPLGLAPAYSVNLYNAQLSTASLVEFADRCNQTYILENIVAEFNKAYGFLTKRADGKLLWVDRTYVNKGDEVVLYTSQFLYSLARVLRIV